MEYLPLGAWQRERRTTARDKKGILKISTALPFWWQSLTKEVYSETDLQEFRNEEVFSYSINWLKNLAAKLF